MEPCLPVDQSPGFATGDNEDGERGEESVGEKKISAGKQKQTSYISRHELINNNNNSNNNNNETTCARRARNRCDNRRRNEPRLAGALHIFVRHTPEWLALSGQDLQAA